MREKIIIENKLKQEPIAAAIEGEGVQLFEGAWYFDPNQVDKRDLVVTERVYVCPYKGRCYWIDLKTAVSPQQSVIPNIAFTYFEVNPGYEFIQDQIAFYAGEREATKEKIEPLDGA